MTVIPFAQAWASILQELPDSAQPVLSVFAHTGIADVNQVVHFTNLTRDRVSRVLEYLASGGLVTTVNRPLPRPGKRGKPPTAYLLSEGGEEILHSVGFQSAHASGLNDDTALLHRLAMTDIHLSAIKSGRSIRTDKLLTYSNGRNIRPDHLVTLQDDHLLIFEIEQTASMDLLRRITESVQHKQEFFASVESRSCLPEVRMIVNLPRGEKWNKTLRVWQTAVNLVKQQSKRELGFRLFAISLSEFLAAPDWESEHRLLWHEIVPQESASIQKVISQTPEQLMYRTSRQEALALAALWQEFNHQAQRGPGKLPQPDPGFFQVMQLIHAASFGNEDNGGMPYPSIYMLNRYLGMRGKLREKMLKTMHNGSNKVRWNQATIMHHMQVVFDTFLGAHGWNTEGALLVYASVAEWSDRVPRTFGVTVKIRRRQILIPAHEMVMPGDSEVQAAENALAWVLRALFKYGPELGLGRVDFW
jgi:hypothetical protein